MKEKKSFPPELVGQVMLGDTYQKEYRCSNPDCCFSVVKEWICCPYCETRIDWENCEKDFPEDTRFVSFQKTESAINNPLIRKKYCGGTINEENDKENI